MDFTNYPNIAAIAEELGGIKTTMFNKKLTEAAERSWEQFTPEELERINEEAASAEKIGCSYIMPTAILRMGRNEHALLAIPVRDIVWIYGSVTTTRLNFIFPMYKEHEVRIVTRDRATHTVFQKTTAAFTRKKPADDTIAQIRVIIDFYRKGIFYGWSKEMQKLACEYFAYMIETADAQSNG